MPSSNTESDRTSPEKLSYTISEAVQATGLSRATIFKLLKNGDLPRRKVGKRTLIMAADLHRFLGSLDAVA